MSDRFFTFWFAFCALLGLATTAVMIWAVVVLVQWLVTK